MAIKHNRTSSQRKQVKDTLYTHHANMKSDGSTSKPINLNNGFKVKRVNSNTIQMPNQSANNTRPQTYSSDSTGVYSIDKPKPIKYRPDRNN